MDDLKYDLKTLEEWKQQGANPSDVFGLLSGMSAETWRIFADGGGITMDKEYKFIDWLRT